MIRDYTNGKLAEIKAYATEHNLIESFNKTFTRFERHSQEGNEVISILISLPRPFTLKSSVREGLS